LRRIIYLVCAGSSAALSLHARPGLKSAFPRSSLNLVLQQLSAPETAALQAKGILQSYNETIDNFPQPLPALPAPLRALVPAVAGLGAGLVVLRLQGEATRKEREEQEARARAEVEAIKAANQKKVLGPALAIVPALAVAVTVFLGPILAPPEDGAKISATKVQQEKAAAATVDAAAKKQVSDKAKVKAENPGKKLEAETAAKDEVTTAVAQPAAPQPPPPPPLTPTPPVTAASTSPTGGTEFDVPPAALAAGAVAVTAAVAAAGGAGEEGSSAAEQQPGNEVAGEETAEEVVWPVEGKVTSWYDAGVRLQLSERVE